MARAKKRPDLAASPALHFSPASSSSTPAARPRQPEHTVREESPRAPTQSELDLTGKKLVCRLGNLWRFQLHVGVARIWCTVVTEQVAGCFRAWTILWMRRYTPAEPLWFSDVSETASAWACWDGSKDL